ncbi:hypothetical protein [Parasitella parasitica]|uniref:B30.2/SPRY domain-containing protein n=1 Tax=Parasitella parasitica TaxID=35722 RepID=A0A0B7N593_9FUNG|nr:hypothetical protein [Parasitella parasitica]
MQAAYTWIFTTGIIVFFVVIIILLFFTRSPIELPLSFNGDLEDIPSDSEQDISNLSEDARLSYERAKSESLQLSILPSTNSVKTAWQEHYPPNSVPTDITPPQLISIQEKGVSAFEFEWEPEANCFVAGRTEIQFMEGENCVQTNLPLPRNQEVYYWEAKMFDKPETTLVSVGIATKPYPSWRLPGLLNYMGLGTQVLYNSLGWNRFSIGYFSSNGSKCFSSPFNYKSYGLPYKHGDVIGVGYRHRTGSVFFTRNGRKMEEACAGLSWNLFPTIGANGPCQIHVNLGQAGFVFVEANVKKWGLAPSQGTLSPPPAYGTERDTILLGLGTSGDHETTSINIDGIPPAAQHCPPSYGQHPPPYHHNHATPNTNNTSLI